MRVAQAVDRFVEAALAPDLWPEALDAVSRALGAEGATLVLGRTSTTSLMVSRSIAPIVAEYFTGRTAPDPREDRVMPRLQDGFLTDLDSFTAEEIARDPFYQEFLRPHGFGFHAVATLAAAPEPLVLSLKRPLSGGQYDGGDLAGLQAALPHLRGAARVAVSAWRASFAGRLDAFARIGVGAALLDRRGRVVETNEAVPLGDGLSVLARELVAGLASDRAALNQMIAAALRPPGEGPPPGPVAIRRPSGRRPIVAEALPVAGAMRSLLAPGVVIVLLRDLARETVPAAETLRRLFRLTPREAALASHLAAGRSLQEAALAIGISEAHARQRLKSVFAKTETVRQGDLIALLARLR